MTIDPDGLVWWKFVIVMVVIIAVKNVANFCVRLIAKYVRKSKQKILDIE